MSDLARIRASLAGRYVVERELGRGGMATVYLARDLKHGRHVALKVLSGTLGGSAGTERFLREIRTTASLTHPGILPLHDSGEVAGVPFYTMPWVDGESLRELLDREGALPLELAVSIAARVADALGAAHRAGVIHRDVKPENVLISRTGHVWVSDFGLAHALAGSTNERLSSGMVLGSLHYMSPEQALGQAKLSPSSDVYSLGCVLYEMLAGRPPFEGPAATLLPRHITEQPKSVMETRADIPQSVDAAISKALAKDAGARFDNAAEFGSALTGRPTTVTIPVFTGQSLRYARRRWSIIGIGGLAIVIATFAMSNAGRQAMRRLVPAPADSTRYAVLPFLAEATAQPSEIEHLLYDALSRWKGISAVDPLLIADQIAQLGKSAGAADQLAIANRFDAGRYISGDIKSVAGGLRIHARLYDTSNKGRQVAQAYVTIPTTLANADSIISVLADSLLLHGAPADAYARQERGTSSIQALRSYLTGHKALREWEVARADSMFLKATELDPEYAQAYLWRAQLRNWTGRDDAAWRSLAAKAATGAERLSAKERILAAALDAQGKGDFVGACGMYRELRSRDIHDFNAVYGLAECLRRDMRVVPDRSSPSGWSFRTSAHEAVTLYQSAFQILPASHKALREGAFSHVRTVFFTSANVLRSGVSEAGELFAAPPEWISDSLAFRPHRMHAVNSIATNASSTQHALQIMRGIFRDIARAWVDAYPGSPAALEADAVAREVQGDYPGALAALNAAEVAAGSDKNHSVRLAVAQLWLRTKLALPNDTAELKRVQAYADSLLSDTEGLSPAALDNLANVAVLTGRGALAARLARLSARRQPGRVAVTPVVTAPARALLIFASLNGPVDSIVNTERQVDAAIRNSLEQSRWVDAHYAHTARAATIALPVYRSPYINESVSNDDYLVRAQLAFLRGDQNAMLAILDTTVRARGNGPASTLKADALYPEAWMVAQARGVRAAGEWLCPMLNSISHFEPGTLNDFAMTGTLSLAMLLYSQLLRASGVEAEADRWQKAVAIMWSNADPAQKRLAASARLQSGLLSPQVHTVTSATPQIPQARSCFPGGT